MDDKRKYDPEDIESLLMHKTFEELYPEEKTFILEHLDSSAEYATMRKTLLTVVAASNDHDRIVPDPAIKDSLLAEFGSQKKGGFTVWLNSIFVWLAPPKIEWYRKPAFQMAFASIALIIGIFVFTSSEEMRFADAAKPGDETTSEDLETITHEWGDEEDEISEEFKAKIDSENTLESTDQVTITEDTFFASTQDGDAILAPDLANGANEITMDLSEGSLALDAATFTIEDTPLADDDFGTDFTITDERVAITDAANKDESQRAENEEESRNLLDFNDEMSTVSGDVSTEKLATKATIPTMVDDVAIRLSEIRDDQAGNAMIGQVESIKISATQLGTETDIKTATDVDFDGESLFSKKTAGIPVRASTRKYKDLIDLLYTAM